MTTQPDKQQPAQPMGPAMATQLMYREAPTCLEASALVMACDTDVRGPFVVVDQTVFYPQGGGQPADQGEIQGADMSASVVDVRLVGGRVHHYLAPRSPGDGLSPGQAVRLKVHAARRHLHARYHTAGHFVAALGERLWGLQAIKAHQFPGGSLCGVGRRV
ncbi:alanine--tRNA ligase-related protein [Candidatus Hepatobacter penaei]|uniref:alanine--tRNA ligase-related protein n=1 Tax=Candidatus Hepatobacter penaei TaxID=1274402 RepID=UPI000696D9F2|nr:alanine--tRNA ligase-related protein [Candidatus Hepatobacter penaei]TGW15120.1 hypothetical protein EIL50_02760 [bacterium NHP-B]